MTLVERNNWNTQLRGCTGKTEMILYFRSRISHYSPGFSSVTAKFSLH